MPLILQLGQQEAEREDDDDDDDDGDEKGGQIEGLGFLCYLLLLLACNPLYYLIWPYQTLLHTASVPHVSLN